MTATLAQVIDDFAFLDDWEDRYRHLIELGRQMLPLREDEMVEANKVSGCMSQVWFVSDKGEGGRYHFRADSDALIVKGLIAVLLLAYSDKTADEIAEVDIDGIFKQLGLDQHLSPNRRNGFFSMVGRIKALSLSE